MISISQPFVHEIKCCLYNMLREDKLHSLLNEFANFTALRSHSLFFLFAKKSCLYTEPYHVASHRAERGKYVYVQMGGRQLPRPHRRSCCRPALSFTRKKKVERSMEQGTFPPASVFSESCKSSDKVS